MNTTDRTVKDSVSKKDTEDMVGRRRPRTILPRVIWTTGNDWESSPLRAAFNPLNYCSLRRSAMTVSSGERPKTATATAAIREFTRKLLNASENNSARRVSPRRAVCTTARSCAFSTRTAKKKNTIFAKRSNGTSSSSVLSRRQHSVAGGRWQNNYNAVHPPNGGKAIVLKGRENPKNRVLNFCERNCTSQKGVIRLRRHARTGKDRCAISSRGVHSEWGAVRFRRASMVNNSVVGRVSSSAVWKQRCCWYARAVCHRSGRPPNRRKP